MLYNSTDPEECSAITLIRYLTEHTKDIPPGVLTVLLVQQDALAAIAEVMDRQLWRRKVKGKLQKFSDGKWVSLAMILQLQSWLLAHPDRRSTFHERTPIKFQRLKLKYGWLSTTCCVIQIAGALACCRVELHARPRALMFVYGLTWCRGKYEWDEFKKAGVIRLRKYMNEVLLDQLPVLADTQRTLDHLQVRR